MLPIYFKRFIYSVFLLLYWIGGAQNNTLSNDAKISIITCGLGNETYSYFGHTAIRVNDTAQNLDVVYNYGAFDFRTPNFVMKFAKGDLQYFVVAHSFIEFINDYNYERRSVYEQELALSTTTKQKLFDLLNKTLYSEERYYTYKFIDKNCTSMVVDIVNKAIGEPVIKKIGDTDQTYRSVLFPYFDGHFYEKLGTSIIFGTKVDQPASKIFLPFDLKESLDQTNLNQKKLVKESQTLLKFKKETPASYWNNVYTYLLLLTLIIIANQKIVNVLYLLTLASIGLFFILCGMLSWHQELAFNYNIALFSPLLFILLIFMLLKNKKWTYRFALIHIVLLVLYTIYISNKAHFVLLLPLIITTGTLLTRIAIKNKSRIPIII